MKPKMMGHSKHIHTADIYKVQSDNNTDVSKHICWSYTWEVDAWSSSMHAATMERACLLLLHLTSQCTKRLSMYKSSIYTARTTRLLRKQGHAHNGFAMVQAMD
jgi:hypothetical protein